MIKKSLGVRDGKETQASFEGEEKKTKSLSKSRRFPLPRLQPPQELSTDLTFVPKLLYISLIDSRCSPLHYCPFKHFRILQASLVPVCTGKISHAQEGVRMVLS